MSAKGSKAGAVSGAAPGKLNKRQMRMLQAALEEFADRGYDGATWRSIATRAGVSQGLIKFYFNDKEGLWRAALVHAHQLMTEDLPPPPFSVDENPPTEITAQWIRSYVIHAARHPEYFKMVMREAASPNPRITWAAQHVRSAALADFQRGLQLLQRRGFYKGLDPVLLQYAFLGAAHQPFLASAEIRAVYGLDATTDAMIQAHSDAMVTLFLGNFERGN